MSDAADVLAAAKARAMALSESDADELQRLLHEEFSWVSHTGETFDRERYIQANTGGHTRWRQQDLGQPEAIVVGDTAVLRTIVTDTIQTDTGEETFQMPMTQVWVRVAHGWRCLSGHAGPRI